MNERIKLLADQATSILDVKHEGYRGNVYTEQVEFFDKEKFAELIVRECIDCARGAGLADDVAVRNGLGFNDGISEAVTHMKQHFGVEE